MRAALYIRVSTHRQVDRESLPLQKKETQNYAKYILGIDDVVIFEDAGISAKNTDRPKFLEMMRRVENGEFTHIIIWKMDRVFRSVLDFVITYEKLKELDVKLISTMESFDPDTAMGNAMLQTSMVFAELERKNASERVIEFMLDRADSGLWNGATVPIGYEYCEKIEYPKICEKESKVVQMIFNLYKKTGSTLRTASILNSNNIPTKRGGQWVAKTVRDILRNSFYIGTYTYNKRDNSKGKYAFKDKSEWIVKENNHKGIIDESLFYEVGEMLSKNYRGLDDVRRENTNIHIFAKKLYCGNCGDLMTAGLDTARKDGYRPSRYVCSTYHTKGVDSYCSNFISDITIGPFMVNYVANLISLQDKVTKDYSLKRIEKSLLRGAIFSDVTGIDKASLKETYKMLLSGFDKDEFEHENNERHHINVDKDLLMKEKQKFEKALQRLEDLYLFSEDSMSKSDYILKQKKLLASIKKIEKQLSELMADSEEIVNEVFVDKAAHFIVSQELQRTKTIDYREFLDLVGKELIDELMSSIIEEVVVDDRRVSVIVFKNGVKHSFSYQAKTNLPAKTYAYPENGAYRVHFDAVLDYIDENGYITRRGVEDLVNIKRHSALTLLNELISLDKIERKRDSIAIKYCLKQQKIDQIS